MSMASPGATVGLAILIGCFAAMLIWQQVSHIRRVKADRSALFEDCGDLFTDLVVDARGLDFPTARGTFKGKRVRIQPVVDSLGIRTLPTLWLVITVDEPIDVRGECSILARPVGTEFYSRHHVLTNRLRPEPPWPPELSVRVSDASCDWLLEDAARAAVCALMQSDTRIKELVMR